MKGTPHEVAMQTSVYTRHQVDRCLRYAFEYARRCGKKARGRGEHNTLTLVGKTNVLTFVYNLWERTFTRWAAGTSPTSNASTATSTPPACGWSRAPRISTCW